MCNSIIGATYDLLAFYGEGNDSTLDQCFTKVTKYFALDVNEGMRRRLRNVAFHYLRSTGYIDVVRSGSTTNWSLSPSALVQRHERDFVLIGGTREATALRKVVGAHQLGDIRSQNKGYDLGAGILFFPEVTQYIASIEEAVAVAKKTNLSLSLDFQTNLFKHLPSINSVVGDVLVINNNTEIFDQNSAKYFSTEDRTWKPYAEMRPFMPGLFKHEFRFSLPQYLIATNNSSNELEIFRLLDREWALVCFSHKLNIKVPLCYNQRKQRLSIAKPIYELRMPTLLERCFRSGTLLAPELDSEWLHYDNISQRNLWRLIAKLPIFKVELV
jgi:hypothetical protein